MGNVLVIDGHPDPASLTAHLATSYATGAGASATSLVLRAPVGGVDGAAGLWCGWDMVPSDARRWCMARSVRRG